MPHCCTTFTRRTGWLLAFITDLVMGLFVTTLTAIILPTEDRSAFEGVHNLAHSFIILLDVFAILHMTSVWEERLGAGRVQPHHSTLLRLWFTSTGLFFSYYRWDGPYRCSFITILILYHFISLLVGYTLKKGGGDDAANIADDGGEDLTNHELKEVKTPDAVAANVELVEVCLGGGEGGAAGDGVGEKAKEAEA